MHIIAIPAGSKPSAQDFWPAGYQNVVVVPEILLNFSAFVTNLVIIIKLYVKNILKKSCYSSRPTSWLHDIP